MSANWRSFLAIGALLMLNISLIAPSLAYTPGAEEEGGLLFKEEIEGGWLWETEEMKVKVTAVGHDVFRLTAVPRSQDWPTEPGTFILPVDSPFQALKKFDTKDEFGISTESGVLGISKDSLRVYLTREDGEVKLGEGRLLWHPEDPAHWDAVFSAPPGERNYGTGNPGLGRSGGLMKSQAQTNVGNGLIQIPFFWSTAGYGMLVDFEEKGAKWRKVSGRHCWRVPGETLDLYFLLGETPYQMLDAYTDLTGKPPIPPLWTFGFMMSRWGYSDWEDIRQKWYTFRRKEIPIDVFIYDYDWYEKDWQWNNKFFPRPRKNLREAAELGLKVVGIRKPRVEDEENFKLALSRGWLLPDTKNDLNFSLPEVREWWWQKHSPLFKDGMAGWWNDEAEQTMTEYYYMVKSQYDGMLAQKPNKRVWTINRAFSPGLQRLGVAVWTGDINSSWETLGEQPGTLLNYAMAGMSYGSQDLGGFIGLPSPELYVRWIQQGVFIPVMRAHSQQHSDRWPWAFGGEAEVAAKKAIELRYRLIPYLYSYAREANQTGAPLMRPLFFEFPDDPQTFNMEDEWFMGGEILAAPLLNPGGKREIYLPAGTWYDFNTGQPVEGPAVFSIKASLDEIPLYVRAGSILPLGSVIQHTAEKKKMPLDIHIYPGGDAEFLFYEDDGETYAYENGDYRQTLLRWEQATCSLTAETSGGTYNGPWRYMVNKIYLYNAAKPLGVTLNGKRLPRLRGKSTRRIGWFYDSENRQVKVITGSLSLNRKIKLEFAPRVSKLLLSKNSKSLLTLLNKRKGGRRSIILRALMQAGDKEDVAVVRQAALNDENEINRQAAVEIISAYGAGERAFFKECLRDSSPAVRFAAARALGKLKAEAKDFITLFGDSSEEVRNASQSALEILASQGNQEAIDFLIQRLKKENLAGKIRIIKVLAPCCNQEKVFKELTRLLQTPDSSLRQAVLQMLRGYHLGEDYFNFLMPLAFDKDEDTALLAREALSAWPGAEKYFGQPIRNWKVIGPFDNTDEGGFAKAYPPEKGVEMDASCPGLGGRVFWKDISADNAGVVDLLKVFPQHPENVCAYGLTIIKSEREKDAQLWLGSDDGVKVWLNGDPIWSKGGGRGLKKDEDKVKVKLKKGENALLIKVCQGQGAWQYTLRLADSQGGLNEVSYLPLKGAQGECYLSFFGAALALVGGIKAKASSCQEEGDAHKAENALDKDMSTRWSSEFSDPQWLEVDWGKSQEITGVTLNWEAAYGKTYDILLSQDGENWEKVYSTTQGNGLTDDIYFNKRLARFLKIYCKERGTSWGYSLHEVSLKGADEEMIFTASSCLSRCAADKVMDGQVETGWHSERKEDSWLQIEMKKAGQLGAISIDWGKDYAVSYQVLASKDGKNWQVICEEKKGDGGSDKIFANIPIVKFIKIVANKSSNNNGYEIKELGLEKWEDAAMTNALDRRRGLVCLERSKWKTFTGSDGSFAPEPWPYQVSFWLWDGCEGKLYTPQTMKTSWQLQNGRLPINIIKWSADDIEVTTTIFAHNILPGDAQVTFARISLKNNASKDKDISLCTVLRENPVSPRKGEKELKEIKYDGGNWVSINGKNGLYLSSPADKPNCGTGGKKADIQNWADVKLLKQGDCVSSPGGKAKATLVHHIELKAGEEKSLDLFSPSAREGKSFSPDLIAALDFESNLEAVKKYWQNRVPLELNVPDKNYSDVFYSSIYYLLLLMDGDLLCPGPSAYNHFFLHDAADMAEALDKVGLKDVVRAAVEDFDYTDSQYLDELGGNIYALFSHYKLNEDADWLEKFYPRMLEKSKILKRLRAEQLKPEFKGTVAYGLLPKSVSQDNFTIPAYLYVDNWWSLIGLKAAMESAVILNKPDDLRWLTNEYNDLLKCLLASMEMVKKREGTDFYPGFADDWPAKYRKVDQLYRILGETQMAWAHRPALFPGEAMGIEIPLDGFRESYQSYWEKAGAFSGYDGGWFVEYENLFWGYNVKLARPLISLGMEDVALKNLKWSLQHQSCPGAWMEAIPSKVNEKGLKEVNDNGGIVGDVPHGWVAAHYVLLLRDMLLRETDEKIILLSCVPPAWLEDGKCIEIKNAPTFFGLVSYSLQSHLKDDYLKLNLNSEKEFSGGFILKLPVEKNIRSVKIDGKDWKEFKEKEVEIPSSSKEILVCY